MFPKLTLQAPNPTAPPPLGELAEYSSRWLVTLQVLKACKRPPGIMIFNTCGFPKIRSTLFGGRYNKDHNILGFRLGSLILGNYQIVMTTGPLRLTVIPTTKNQMQKNMEHELEKLSFIGGSTGMYIRFLLKTYLKVQRFRAYNAIAKEVALPWYMITHQNSSCYRYLLQALC